MQSDLGKCGDHPKMTEIFGALSTNIEHIKEVSKNNSEKLEKLMEGYLNNKNLIDQLSKDMKNGLSTKVNQMEINLAKLTECLTKERIERQVSIEGWFNRSFHKALDNLGVIITAVLIWKIITWVATCPGAKELAKKMAGF